MTYIVVPSTATLAMDGGLELNASGEIQLNSGGALLSTYTDFLTSEYSTTGTNQITQNRTASNVGPLTTAITINDWNNKLVGSIKFRLAWSLASGGNPTDWAIQADGVTIGTSTQGTSGDDSITCAVPADTSTITVVGTENHVSTHDIDNFYVEGTTQIPDST